MKYLAAYLLANLNGSQPSAKEINSILSSIGVESDSARVDQLLSSLEGKDLASVSVTTKHYSK